jgi:hypothetical protein
MTPHPVTDPLPPVRLPVCNCVSCLPACSLPHTYMQMYQKTMFHAGVSPSRCSASCCARRGSGATSCPSRREAGRAQGTAWRTRELQCWSQRLVRTHAPCWCLGRCTTRVCTRGDDRQLSAHKCINKLRKAGCYDVHHPQSPFQQVQCNENGTWS